MARICVVTIKSKTYKVDMDSSERLYEHSFYRSEAIYQTASGKLLLVKTAEDESKECSFLTADEAITKMNDKWGATDNGKAFIEHYEDGLESI